MELWSHLGPSPEFGTFLERLATPVSQALHAVENVQKNDVCLSSLQLIKRQQCQPVMETRPEALGEVGEEAPDSVDPVRQLRRRNVRVAEQDHLFHKI